MGLFENEDQMWFGTIGNMRWIQAPLTGMDSSPQASSAGSVLLDGDGYSRKSWGSHKLYQMSWSESETPRFAQLIQGYASGAYGRGPIYFSDPLTHALNALPAKWSYPAIAVGGGGGRIIEGQPVTSVPTPANNNDLPSQTAKFTVPSGLNSNAGNFDWNGAVFVPIPEGYSLFLGAMYSSPSSSVGIAIMPLTSNGEPDFSASTQLPRLANDEIIVVPTRVDHGPSGGVIMYVYNTGPSDAELTFTAAIARLANTAATNGYFVSGYGDLPFGDGLYGGMGQDYDGFLSAPWSLGMGNGGCRFEGQPTLVEYNGIGEGQVGLTCVLRETGALHG